MSEEKLSQSLEDYLEAVYMVSREQRVVRVKDLIKKLNVRTASVIGALKKLEQRGLVEHERYGYIDLTAEGEKVAAAIYEKHRMLLRFLTQSLKVNKETAERDACAMEHCISEETFGRVVQLIKLMETAPPEVASWFEGLGCKSGTRNDAGGKSQHTP